MKILLLSFLSLHITSPFATAQVCSSDIGSLLEKEEIALGFKVVENEKVKYNIKPSKYENREDFMDDSSKKVNILDEYFKCKVATQDRDKIMKDHSISDSRYKLLSDAQSRMLKCKNTGYKTTLSTSGCTIESDLTVNHIEQYLGFGLSKQYQDLKRKYDKLSEDKKKNAIEIKNNLKETAKIEKKFKESFAFKINSITVTKLNNKKLIAYYQDNLLLGYYVHVPEDHEYYLVDASHCPLTCKHFTINDKGKFDINDPSDCSKSERFSRIISSDLKTPAPIKISPKTIPVDSIKAKKM